MTTLAPDDAAPSVPSVSVVIPARDAAATLPATLGSLRAQSCAAWEAIVVNDGSRDATGALAARAAAEDRRVRLLSRRDAGGASDARNAGLAAAAAEWVLFLDADDVLEPPARLRLLAALDDDPVADAAPGGWWWTDPAGRLLAEGHADPLPDLFPALARYCVFATTSVCLVRAALVREVGGFDRALRTSEDFDLWQRVARAGARFAAVPETVVRYRLRPGASWFDAPRFLRDGLEVIARGHAPDPRVPHPAPEHAAGAPPDGRASAAYLFATWAAAVALAHDGDAAPLLDLVPDAGCPDLDAEAVATALAFALPLVARRPASALPELHAASAARRRAFLDALERRAGARGLAARAEALLDLAVAAAAATAGPATVMP